MEREMSNTVRIVCFTLAISGVILSVCAVTWMTVTWGEDRGPVPSILGWAATICLVLWSVLWMKYGRK